MKKDVNEKRILNLGCGNKPMDGVVNHDVKKHRPEIDIVHDLNILPWPWKNDSFDKIYSITVFEHLDIDLVKSLDECHRILVKGGQVILKLPLHTGSNVYDDPTHRWFFSLRSFDQFCPETKRGKDYGFYTDKKWKFVKKPTVNSAKTSVYVTLQTI